jgi:hypothetical protein
MSRNQLQYANLGLGGAEAVAEAKTVFAGSDAQRAHAQKVVQLAKDARKVRRLAEHRSALLGADCLKVATIEDKREISRAVDVIDKMLALLYASSGLTEETAKAIDDVGRAGEDQARAGIAMLENFDTADAHLLDALSSAAVQLRLEWGITEPTPRTPAGEMARHDAATTHDRAARLVDSLETLLARTTHPQMVQAFGDMVRRLREQFGLAARTV